jgi:hypothetical protein
MRTVPVVQTSFTSGELDPQIGARIEVSRYYSGARRLRNVLVRPQGGARRRPGLRHRATLPAAANAGLRLIPFAFSATQTYLVVLMQARFHVYAPTGALLYASAGTDPWTAAMAAEMNWTQSADTLILTHQDLPPQRILRAGSDSSWTRDVLPLANIPTFDFGAVAPSGSLTPSVTGGPAITITASAAPFTPAMVGWEISGGGGRARITAFLSASQVTATTEYGRGDAFAGVAAFTDWFLEEPVISAARGWPECASFHQGRLWFGGLRSRPTTLIGSRVAAFFDFDIGTGLDDEAIMVSIDSDQLNAVHQLLSARGLQIYTSGAEHAVTVAPPITPSNIAIEEQTRRGARRFSRVAELDGAALFIQRGGRGLRQFLYEEVQQAFSADLVSLLSPHLILDPRDVIVRKGAVADDADHILLADAAGAGITVLTSLRAQEVTAFTRWTLDGQVRGVAALIGGEVFVAVLRDGAVRLLQWDETALTDHAAIVTGVLAEPYTVAGLGHLAGQTCQVVADGRVWADVEVPPSGEIDLPAAANRVEIGIGFATEIETMPVEPRDPTGALIGRKCRLVRAAVRVLDSGAFDIAGTSVALRTVGEPPAPLLDVAPQPPPPLVAGDIDLRGIMGWREQHSITVSQPAARPQPLNVLAIALTVAPGGPF